MNNILSLKLSQSSSLSWFNALIGRICFDILNEQFWSNYVAIKIQRKLRRLRLPYFMESLTITEIDLGNNLPKFNDVTKSPVVDKRGLWIDFDITYSGMNLIKIN
jgi:Ca2+-dependent lipid-binding protein